jgi:DNA-binding transcriptional LysR family regulator
MVPTLAAGRLEPYAARVLDRTGDVRRLIDGLGREQPVRIAVAPTYATGLLPRVVADFARSRPETPLDIRIATTTGIHEALREGQVDVGLAGGALVDADLHDDLLGHDELVVLAPKDHPLVALGSVDFADYVRYPHISLPIRHPIGRAVADAMEKDADRASSVIMVDAFELGVRLCEAGVAPVVVSRLSSLQADYDRVARLRLRPAMNYAVVARRLRTTALSASARHFVAMFRDALGRIEAEAP